MIFTEMKPRHVDWGGTEWRQIERPTFNGTFLRNVFLNRFGEFVGARLMGPVDKIADRALVGTSGVIPFWLDAQDEF
ncbi:hypothetical protein C464_01641 [Halorubrum coriense DSM 10284]|uniref:Uncharacterized protein n=1 Tax=Halorubrum coriense DSM 10284 TaxID=1227466 RepID=M0EWI2_9EURY|nr:hypothetical protein C464_01641 [Halorubrum coriense DSM 10284]